MIFLFFYLVFINALMLLCTPRKFFLSGTFMLYLLSLRYIYLSSFRYSRSPARPSSPPGGLEAPSSSDEEKVKTKMHQLSLSRRLKRKFMFYGGVSLIEIHAFTFLLFAQKALLWSSLITSTLNHR